MRRATPGGCGVAVFIGLESIDEISLVESLCAQRTWQVWEAASFQNLCPCKARGRHGWRNWLRMKYKKPPKKWSLSWRGKEEPGRQLSYWGTVLNVLPFEKVPLQSGVWWKWGWMSPRQGEKSSSIFVQMGEMRTHTKAVAEAVGNLRGYHRRSGGRSRDTNQTEWRWGWTENDSCYGVFGSASNMIRNKKTGLGEDLTDM